MLARLLYVLLGTAAFICVLWLEEAGNYMALMIVAGIGVLVMFVGCAFLFIISAPSESGMIEKALQRRSAKAITNELLARVGRK